MVKTHMCIRGEEAVAKVSKEFEKGTTLYNIVRRGILNVGALEGQELRKEFQIYINAVVERFSELGHRVLTNVIKYSNGLDLVGALLKGKIDLIHPGFYVDELSAGRLRELQPLCTGVGLEFAYFVKEKTAGEGSPYKNMKALIEHTLDKNKKVFIDYIFSYIFFVFFLFSFFLLFFLSPSFPYFLFILFFLFFYLLYFSSLFFHLILII